MPQHTSDISATSAPSPLDFERINLWQQFVCHITPSFYSVVEFAKRVPGFSDLWQDDQLTLIKSGFFELWLCRVSQRSAGDIFTLSDEVSFTRQQIELIYDTNFASILFDFINSFNSMGYDVEMKELFCGLILMSTNRPGIAQIRVISEHQNNLTARLKLLASQKGYDEQQVFDKLLELRMISAKHTHALEWYRSNLDELQVTPLFAEIFDLNNSD